jgi:hypothetical protein
LFCYCSLQSGYRRNGADHGIDARRPGSRPDQRGFLMMRWKRVFTDLAQAYGCGFLGGFVASFLFSFLYPDRPLGEAVFDPFLGEQVLNFAVFAALIIAISLWRERREQHPRRPIEPGR